MLPIIFLLSLMVCGGEAIDTLTPLTLQEVPLPPGTTSNGNFNSQLVSLGKKAVDAEVRMMNLERRTHRELQILNQVNQIVQDIVQGIRDNSKKDDPVDDDNEVLELVTKYPFIDPVIADQKMVMFNFSSHISCDSNSYVSLGRMNYSDSLPRFVSFDTMCTVKDAEFDFERVQENGCKVSTYFFQVSRGIRYKVSFIPHFEMTSTAFWMEEEGRDKDMESHFRYLPVQTHSCGSGVLMTELPTGLEIHMTQVIKNYLQNNFVTLLYSQLQ